MSEEVHNDETNISGDNNTSLNKVNAGGNIEIDRSQTKNVQHIHGHNLENARFSGDFVGGDKVAGNKVIQHFHGKKSVTHEDIPELLKAGSRIFYDWIMGPQGRFEHLRISEHILAGIAEGRKAAEGHLNIAALQALWQETGNGGNALVIGQEGMGKTVSLIWLWGQYLQQDQIPVIPIYVALNQYNRAAPEIQRKFLTTYIARYYLGARILENDLENSLWAWLQQSKDSDQGPKLLLMLDGLNEVSGDITPLLIQLNEEWINIGRKSGIQIVITTHFYSNHKFTEGFQEWYLQKLSKEQIAAYLKEQQSAVAYDGLNEKLRDLLSTPMLLSLFAGVQNEASRLNNADLKPEINRTAELIWNYIEMKLARFEEANRNDPEECARNHFLVQYLLPFIAYRMEIDMTLEIRNLDLEELINEAFRRFNEPHFFRSSKSHRKHIQRYRRHIRALQVGELALVEEIGRFERLMHDFTKELFPVGWEGVMLRFTHHSYQDFFAAKHVMNEIGFSLEKEEIPAVLRERILPPHVRKMLGEMIGEHYQSYEFLPAELPPGRSWNDFFEPTLLDQVLDVCRGVFVWDRLRYTVWNILTVRQEIRGTLIGMDLSSLHLIGFEFNRIDCKAVDPNGHEIKSHWDHCKMSPKQWFSQSHSDGVTVVRISPNGKFLATASEDHTIKLWYVDTNQYVRTFHGVHGHEDRIYAIAFSPDSNRIVSVSEDHKIIEWRVKDGACLQVYRGHSGWVRSVDYHPNGKCILTASEDGTVKEWSIETGKCQRTYRQNGDKAVLCVRYVYQGRSFVAGMKDEAAVMVSTATGSTLHQFLPTAKGPETGGAASVHAMTCSPCGSKLLTLCTWSETGKWHLEEWRLENGESIQTLQFKEAPKPLSNIYFADVAYSPSGHVIMAAGMNDNIYEWQANAPLGQVVGKNTQHFSGHARRVLSIAFDPSGEHFYSGSYDATIIKWSALNGQIERTFRPASTAINCVIDLGYDDADGNKTPSMVIASEDKTIRIHRWSAVDGSTAVPETFFKADAPVYDMQYYEAKKYLVTGGEWGAVQVWSLKGECQRKFDGHPDTVSSLAVDQENGLVVSVDVQGNILLWSLLNEQFIQAFPKQSGAITHVAHSPVPGDRRFVTSNKNGNVQVWTSEPGVAQPLIASFHHGSRVYAIDFDGCHVISGGIDGKLIEWDIENKRETVLWEHPTGRPILYAAYSPDGTEIMVSVHKENRLVKLPVGPESNRQVDQQNIQSFAGHQDYILTVAFAEDGKTVLSASEDATLRGWDRESGHCLWSIQNVVLNVGGLDFREVRWTEPLTDLEWNLLELYGAKL